MAICGKLGVFVVLLAVCGPLIWRYRDHREYNFRTTATEAANNVDLTGKVIIVTGANTGIGEPTARVLFEHGATVIMASRNMEKANQCKKRMLAQQSNSDASERLHVLQLDLSSLQSVDEFAENFKSKFDRLDYLVLNAGVSPAEWNPTENGIESTFGVNHVGHYRLAMNLTPLLVKSASSTSIGRVISVASWAHMAAPQPLTDWFANDTLIQSKNAFHPLRAYALSKAANILFAAEYNERHKQQNVYAVSLHPGSISTELTRHAPAAVQWIWTNVFANTIFKSREEGAATTVRTLSINDSEFQQDGGSYWSDCNQADGVFDLRSDMFPTNVPETQSPQKLLWSLTEKMIQKYA